MAERDLRWFKYLSDALKVKYRNPQLSTFGGYRFEPTIYKWMRQTFDTLHQRYGINYEDYLNIGERPVLERLIRNLRTDTRLTFLNDPQPEEVARFELPEEFHQTIEQEQQAEQPVVSEGAPPSTGAQPGQAPPSAPSRGPSIPQIPQMPQMPQMPALPSVKDVEKEGEEAVKKEEEQVAKSPRGPTGRGIRIPQGVRSAAKSVGSQAGVAFKKGSSRALIGARKGLGAAIGRGGRAALGGINLGINAGIDFSNAVSRLRVGTIGKKWLIGLLLLLLLVALLLFISPGTSTPPLPPGFVDVSQCLFTRSDQNPPQAKYQSPLLLSYFTDAYNLTGIHQEVLAAFVRVESPSLTSYTDDQIKNYQCAESPTGALGVMQLQPAGTTGYCSACIENGARLIGKTADTLTKEDYCDIRKSIIIGSGWILKKMSFLGYGDGSSWDPSWTNNKDAIYALVNGYYGCILYPSCTTGPYSYGDDVWQSIQACTPTAGQIPTEKLGKIVYWAQTISNVLERGSCLSLYNRMVSTITNGIYTAVTRTGDVCDGTGPDGWYWCTNLIIDSYNLSGVAGLNLNHQGVKNMLSFWQNDPNYSTIPYDVNNGMSSLTQIKPGFTIFRISTSGAISDHVDIIEDVNIDIRGDGFITTIDSNTTRKRFQLFVSGWQITEIPGFAPIWGFGGIK